MSSSIEQLQSPLEGEVSEAEVQWKGDGIWEPESMCFDWTNDDFMVRKRNILTLFVVHK